MNIYFICILVAFLGMILTQVFIVQKQQKKYRIANLKWDWSVYWKSDFLLQIVGTIATVGIGLLLLDPFIAQFPQVEKYPFYVGSFFAFVGYTGADAATKFFSAINNRYNSAVDYKTNLADAQTGNLDNPTPAEKPVKPQN